MMPNWIIEITILVSMCMALPGLCVAMWNGWKLEKHRADQISTEGSDRDAVD